MGRKGDSIRPTALVTGGGRRVGRAISLHLAKAGYDLAVTYNRSSAEARSLVRRVERAGAKAHAIAVNLAAPDAADLLHKQFRARFDRLDALVNNASIFSRTPIGTITVDQFEQHMSVNTRAPLMLIQKFAPMLAAGASVKRPATLGRVVNFVDTHVLGQPHLGYAPYIASKAALVEITRGLALELAPKITVNAIAPGVIEWAKSFSQTQRKAYLKRVPLARPGTPTDAARTVLFLVRDAHYITGQVLRLDGGRGLT